jgi:retron-type reverse transcriptase
MWISRKRSEWRSSSAHFYGTDIPSSQYSHTALREIYYNWAGATWIIEGDISDCFGSFDHELLIATLSEKIHDGRFLNLMRKLLDAGYLEDWKFNKTLSGVPQGSIVSPILSNILLDTLDRFVETVLIPQYTRGDQRKPNKEYEKLISRDHRRFKKGQTKAAQEIRRQAQKLPSKDAHDPDYRRLKYCRYADDVRHLTRYEILLAEKGGSEV